MDRLSKLLSHELYLAPLPIDRLSKLLSHELCLAPLPMDRLSKSLCHELCLAPLSRDRLSMPLRGGLHVSTHADLPTGWEGSTCVYTCQSAYRVGEGGIYMCLHVPICLPGGGGGFTCVYMCRSAYQVGGVYMCLHMPICLPGGGRGDLHVSTRADLPTGWPSACVGTCRTPTSDHPSRPSACVGTIHGGHNNYCVLPPQPRGGG